MRRFPKKFFIPLLFLFSAIAVAVVINLLFLKKEASLVNEASTFKNFPISENDTVPNLFSFICKINSVDSEKISLESSSEVLEVYRSANCNFIDSSGNPASIWVPLAVNNISNNTSFVATKGTAEGLFEPLAFDVMLQGLPPESDVSIAFSWKNDIPMDAEKVFSTFISDLYKGDSETLSEFIKNGNTNKIPKYKGLTVIVPLDIQVIRY